MKKNNKRAMMAAKTKAIYTSRSAWSIKRKGITGRKYMAGAVQTWQPNFESLFAASVRATIDREVTRR